MAARAQAPRFSAVSHTGETVTLDGLLEVAEDLVVVRGWTRRAIVFCNSSRRHYLYHSTRTRCTMPRGPSLTVHFH
jgi:hypothetical protein